ncbi:MAG: cytochrome c oxidase assembly protein [Alphaproteobacteria bacterium]|nr:cytochrome c oxidase assembly protein [Alphaproteobacteria bacterium]
MTKDPDQKETMTREAALARKNKRLMFGCVLAVAFMVGMSFASVPLYNIFCRVTGYGGTTQVGTAPTDETVYDRKITVRFDASMNTGLPWQFNPEQREITLRVGETGMAFYKAESLAKETTVGTATFNVTPLKAGQYFVKTQCFCFTEQALTPGQVADMPVSFYIDPGIMEDSNLNDTNTITLSYTFYRKKDAETAAVSKDDTAAISNTPPVN